ncbi:MAG: hypothetical protein NVS1B7_0390 [Candidatus Saccharimonadales bacterium]
MINTINNGCVADDDGIERLSELFRSELAQTRDLADIHRITELIEKSDMLIEQIDSLSPFIGRTAFFASSHEPNIN